jgi:tRNA nucleotidyltransferase (CCA-adding enzyme)
LQNCGAYKDAEAFTQVLIACKADARGRLGFEEVDYPQLEFWQAVQKVAAAVDNKAIIAQGFQGKEIAEQIEKTRINNISQFIQS